MRDTTREQIEDIYTEMAHMLDYRARPTTGERENITEEAADYAKVWNAEEDTGTFTIGLCNFETRPATIKAIEAARCLCGTADNTALALLKSAVEDLEVHLATK